MSTSKRAVRILVCGIAVLALAVAALFMVRSGPRPVCHRAVDGAFQQWMLESGHTNGFYPNADGIGSNSLAMIESFFGQDILQYAYIPGLRIDDPKDLVLMYLKRPTHYSWHGDTEHTILSPRRWMVVSPDIERGSPYPEGGDLVDGPEFKRRVLRTVAYLKAHDRPHWQVVAKEQGEFLKSVENSSP
jgi:hypothetical protein